MMRAILFDFNGVVVDDEPLHLELFQKVLQEEGVTLDEDDYYRHYLGFDDKGCLRAVLARAGRPAGEDLLSRLIARKSAYYQTRVRAEGFAVFPGAAELIRQARDSALMLGVVSGALRGEVEGALAQIGVRDAFKVLVTAEDTARGKPDPEGYRRGLEALNAHPPLPSRLAHPHEVLALEDAPAGIEAANAAGLATAAVAHTYPAAALADAGADHVFETLDGLRLDDLLAPFGGRALS